MNLVEIHEGTHKTLYEGDTPRYVDVDWKSNIIVSYHNFEETPDLDAVLETLKKAHPEAHFYKIATKARSTLDSLRMMEFLQRHHNIIGLCMGDLGTITRICAPIFGVPLTYAPRLEREKNAPGQLTVDQLCHIYHFRSLNRETLIFGLIGDPVHQSIGHLFHNEMFRTQNQNAVYVKMVVKPDELPEFFRLAKKLPFAGLSVTAPLKEAVIPFVDVLDPLAQAIGAVNTLSFLEGRIFGTNTDGDAALDALGKVAGKKIVVLGAGGAARAIIYTALQRGAEVVVVNRTLGKAQALARQFGCGWSEQVPPCHILINATSVPNIHPAAMDIRFPMYFKQALAQQAIWEDSTKS